MTQIYTRGVLQNGISAGGGQGWRVEEHEIC